MLLSELLRKFPVPQIAPEQSKPEEEKTSTATSKTDANKNDTKVTIKQEPIDETVSNTNNVAPVNNNVQIKQEPPEKKMKMG